MVQPNPNKKAASSTRNLKLLLSTLSVTTALSGWALIALNQPPQTDVAADVPDTPTAVPTNVPPTPLPTDAPVARVIIPPLSSLPVRGLRVVGDAVDQPAAGPAVVYVQQPQRGGGGGGGGGGSQVAPAPAPAPAPKPPPVTHTKGSHP